MFLFCRSILRVLAQKSRPPGRHFHPKRVHVLRFYNLQHYLSTNAAGYVDIFEQPIQSNNAAYGESFCYSNIFSISFLYFFITNFQFQVLLVICNGALAGIVTSFFLKHLNSILKTIAAAIELIFVAILSWIFFSVSIKINTMISIFLISVSIILYSRNPVHNPPNTPVKKDYTENV